MKQSTQRMRRLAALPLVLAVLGALAVASAHAATSPQQLVKALLKSPPAASLPAQLKGSIPHAAKLSRSSRAQHAVGAVEVGNSEALVGYLVFPTRALALADLKAYPPNSGPNTIVSRHLAGLPQPTYLIHAARNGYRGRVRRLRPRQRARELLGLRAEGIEEERSSRSFSTTGSGRRATPFAPCAAPGDRRSAAGNEAERAQLVDGVEPIGVVGAGADEEHVARDRRAGVDPRPCRRLPENSTARGFERIDPPVVRRREDDVVLRRSRSRRPVPESASSSVACRSTHRARRAAPTPRRDVDPEEVFVAGGAALHAQVDNRHEETPVGVRHRRLDSAEEAGADAHLAPG